MVENAKIASITTDNVLFKIYTRKLIIRIESWFWSFDEGMNGITDVPYNVHVGYSRAPYNVHVGYSIHTFMKRPKSTFNS